VDATERGRKKWGSEKGSRRILIAIGFDSTQGKKGGEWTPGEGKIVFKNRNFGEKKEGT